MTNTVKSRSEEHTLLGYSDDRSGDSPVFYTLDLIGNHRKTSVILLLDKIHKADFGFILNSFSGMNQFVLIKILRELEEDCIIKRVYVEEEGGADPKVLYRLTYTGRKLIPIIDELDSWGKEQKRHKALIAV
ncbi:MAG: helix-turn-helix transcriptional regulator [Saccharofermentans sp.]|nr:helix-turn-helix transcriptional regulator [Saccharofermentans sp.]